MTPDVTCTGFDRCPLGLNREFYDRETGRLECAQCPGEPKEEQEP